VTAFEAIGINVNVLHMLQPNNKEKTHMGAQQRPV